MASWHEERRLNNAADAEQRRKDAEFRADLRRKERRADRDEERAERAQQRREKAQRKQARAAKREKTLTPGNVYQRGTLVLVALSALASLPAQILHFVSISWMLFPIGPALEGAAWVMAAGVAYADERKLPVWVRWLLRGLSLSAAGYAASVNYAYGQSLAATGLTPAEAQAVAIGLASVTMGGPLFFEVRQWVLTLTAKTGDPKKRAEDKARAKHDKHRRKEFKDVAKRQKQILLAAPYGTVRAEDAWKTAWLDVQGGPVGVTATSVETRLAAERKVAEVLAKSEESNAKVAVELFLADVFGVQGGEGGTSGGARGNRPQSGPRGSGGGSTLAVPRDSSEAPTALGRKGKQRFGRTAPKTPQKPIDEGDLQKIRALAATLGGAANLSHSAVKNALGGGSNDYLVRVRKTVQSEYRSGK